MGRGDFSRPDVGRLIPPLAGLPYPRPRNDRKKKGFTLQIGTWDARPFFFLIKIAFCMNIMSQLPQAEMNMKDLLNLFRWQDALDILILTFVFYRLYLWVRTKRALRMILAMLALPIYYLLARWIDLPLSVWGLQNLWAVILLVLVVIFQQEIREVLGRITLPSLLFGKPENLPSERLDDIAESAFKMAQQGTGGLIVLQKEDDLDEWIHGQTPLDSELNEEILISVFNSQSPLHDGAVIISRDRIRYAAAILPVSKSLSLPREWGARHRAGLGITEVSDAACIIISEERKEVLVVSGGKAEKKETREDLKRSLSGLPLTLGERERKKRWPGRILEDLPVKALLLLLVCLLWGVLIGIHQGEISFSIPVEYYSMPPHLIINGEPPREINVRLKGSQRLLSVLNPDRLRVQIDLSNSHPGINQLSLSQTNINVPSGITVTNLYPQKIRLQLSLLPRRP
jgi:diadenylate cyclase